MRISAWADRTRRASRIVGRLTPNCDASAASFGSRCSGVDLTRQDQLAQLVGDLLVRFAHASHRDCAGGAGHYGSSATTALCQTQVLYGPKSDKCSARPRSATCEDARVPAPPSSGADPADGDELVALLYADLSGLSRGRGRAGAQPGAQHAHRRRLGPGRSGDHRLRSARGAESLGVARGPAARARSRHAHARGPVGGRAAAGLPALRRAQRGRHAVERLPTRAAAAGARAARHGDRVAVVGRVRARVRAPRAQPGAGAGVQHGVVAARGAPGSAALGRAPARRPRARELPAGVRRGPVRDHGRAERRARRRGRGLDRPRARSRGRAPARVARDLHADRRIPTAQATASMCT